MNFINAIKSPATQKAYNISLRRYLNHLKLKEPDELLTYASNPRYIESQIIEYIMSLRDDGVSYNTIQFLVAPIFTFYQLNDITLNRKKVSRYLGEYKRVVKDGPYTTQQIQQALQNADVRMRCVLLILSSTGTRIGSLPSLTLGNLTKIPSYGLYKIAFYEGTKNETYTFTTRECSTTGIDTYLSYRQRCGEKISFNESKQQWEPSSVPLIRLQFDVNDILQVRNPRPISIGTLREALMQHIVRSGLRQIEHPTGSNPSNPNRVRKSVSLTNGFRKHVISTFIEAGLNHEIRELIVDHATQLDNNYFRPTEDQVLQEYLKAEPYLTIDPAARLARENETLKIEKNAWEALRVEVDNLKALLKT
jgi:site-specific recombinase XerD